MREASPLHCHDIDHANRSSYEVCTTQGGDRVREKIVQKFEDYLRDKTEAFNER